MFKTINLFRSIYRLLITIGATMLISGCIIQVPAPSNSSPNYANLPPDQIAVYNEMTNSNTKNARSIAKNAIPLSQQLAEIEAFLNHPETFSDESELTQQIDAQLKLKKLQNDLDDIDDFNDIDL